MNLRRPHPKVNVLDNILNKSKPEIIIHLAWETTPGKFYEDKINLNWSDATIELIKKFYLQGGKKFIFGSNVLPTLIFAFGEKNFLEYLLTIFG